MNDMTPIDRLAFPVELRPMHVRDHAGGYRIVPDAHTVYCPTTGQAFGKHGKRYKLRPYGDQVAKLREMISETLGIIDAQEKINVFDDGARIRYDVEFPRHQIEPKVNDIVRLRLRYWDSYDAGWASQWSLEGFRLWCLNGCTTRDSFVRGFAKHTSSEINFSNQSEKVGVALERFHRSEAEFKKWIVKPAPEPEVRQLIRTTLAELPPKDGMPHHSKNTMDNVTSRITEETVWGVYNAATHWASHPDQDLRPVRGAIHNVARDRENKVAKMLRGEEWAELVA